MNPDVRTGVLIFALFWCLLFFAMTIAATGSFFFPPRTFGEILADAFTLLGVVLMLGLLRWVIGALRNPPQ